MTPYEAILELAGRLGEPFTSDDVIELCGVPDTSHTANGRNSAIGAAFVRAHREGVIERTGQVRRSRQAHRKGGVVQVWAGTRPISEGRLFVP